MKIETILQHEESNWRRIAEGIETVRLLLRMLTDLKLLSLKYFSAVNVKMEDLYQSVER